MTTTTSKEKSSVTMHSIWYWMNDITYSAKCLIKDNSSIVTFLLALIIMRMFFLNWYIVISDSMNPTINTSEYVSVNKTSYWFSKPQRGDVITFDKDNIFFIKRLIGLPGDSIQMINNELFINGKALERKAVIHPMVINGQFIPTKVFPYETYLEQIPTDDGDYKEYTIAHATGFEIATASYQEKLKVMHNTPEYIVPKGKYFVLGDNRNMSNDSRLIGYVDETAIDGRANKIILGRKDLWDYLAKPGDTFVRFYETL